MSDAGTGAKSPTIEAKKTKGKKFVPHDTLVIPPLKDADDQPLKYGSGKSMAVHLLEYHYGAKCFSKEMAGVFGPDDPPMRYVFIDVIPLFRSLSADRIKNGRDLAQAFMNVVEKEAAQLGDELQHLFILNDNYRHKPMAKGAEDRNRARSQAPVSRAYAEECITDLFAHGQIPEDFEELCRSSRVFIMGMIRYCVFRMLNAEREEEQVGLREGLRVYLAGHYLEEGDVPRLDVTLPANLKPRRLDIPLELVAGNHVRWRTDLMMTIGEGDLMIPAMMRRVLEIEPTPTTMGIYSFDTDLMWTLIYVCHTWLDPAIPVVLRNMPSPAWVANFYQAPPKPKWINIRGLMQAIREDPVFATLKAPVASMTVAAFCGGNDYVDGTPRVPIQHYMNAYRLAAPLIGDMVRLDKGGNGYWELNPRAYPRLVQYACWWSYQSQWKWDKVSVVECITPSEAGTKKIPKNLQARSLNVNYVLYMLNQAGNLNVREPNLALCGFERVDRDLPWALSNIQYQKDDANPDSMGGLADAERFWQEQQSDEERQRRMDIYGRNYYSDVENQRARDSASVDEAERLLQELNPPPDAPMGESSGGSPTIYQRPDIRGYPRSPVPLTLLSEDEDEDEDALPGLSAPLPQRPTPGPRAFQTPAQRNRFQRFATPETERVEMVTPAQRRRPGNLPPTPATEEMGQTPQSDATDRKRPATPIDRNHVSLVADLVFVPHDRTQPTTQLTSDGDISLADVQGTLPAVWSQLDAQALDAAKTWGKGRVFFTYDVFDAQSGEIVRDTTATVFYFDPEDTSLTLRAYLMRRFWRVVQDLGEFAEGHLRRMRRRLE